MPRPFWPRGGCIIKPMYNRDSPGKLSEIQLISFMRWNAGAATCWAWVIASYLEGGVSSSSGNMSLTPVFASRGSNVDILPRREFLPGVTNVNVKSWPPPVSSSAGDLKWSHLEMVLRFLDSGTVYIWSSVSLLTLSARQWYSLYLAICLTTNTEC